MESKPWYKSKKLGVFIVSSALTALIGALAIIQEGLDKGSAAYAVIGVVVSIAGIAMSYLKAQGSVDAVNAAVKANPSQPPPPQP